MTNDGAQTGGAKPDAPTVTGGPTPIPVPPGFPVTWDDDEERTLLWTWDEFHSPLPKTPMTLSLGELTRQGMAQAMRESGRYTPGGRRKVINGYPYSASARGEVPDGEKEARDQARKRLVDQAMAEARRRWDEEWLPRLERDLAAMKAVVLASLDERELMATVDRFLADHSHHWYLHHLVVMPAVEAADRLEKRYEAAMGPQNKAFAHRLLHGAETKTVQSNRALDELASAAAGDADTRTALESGTGNAQLRTLLAKSESGRKWLERFDRYLEAFGCRPGGFDLIYPSWVEDPSFVLQNLRARLGQERPGHRWKQQDSKLNAERDAMLGEVRERLKSDPDALSQFELAYEDAQRLWPLKEDHSHYIDQASTALVRIALAEVGRRLERAEEIPSADDVWYLTFEEARSALAAAGGGALDRARPDGAATIAPLCSLVGERRAARERWSRLRPPRHLGTYPAGYEGERLAPDGGEPAELRELRGTPASSGEATGVAVIVMSPADFGKVRPGNILVCRSTAPMWTPLFGVVAGLVSEAGGVLSHPAVVAREFGLPAVVGVRGATSLIHDGQMLTVSGTAGLVRVDD